MNNTYKNPVWDMPAQHRCKQTIIEGQFYSSKDSPLIISDFKKLPMALDYIKVLEITNSYQSDNIDILHATSDIENIDEFVKSKNYSDVFISLSSEQFVDHVRQTYGDKIVKVDIDGAAPVWQILK